MQPLKTSFLHMSLVLYVNNEMLKMMVIKTKNENGVFKGCRLKFE